MLTVLAFTLALLGSPRTAGPSFDCARASTVVERTICADPELGRLDRRMARRFAVLRRELDPAARAALLEDQRGYLWARDEVSNAMPAAERPDYLRMDLRGRADFLDAVSTAPRTGLTGHWSNFMGDVFVSRQPDGTLRIRAVAAEPTTARWICDFDVNARPVGAKARGVAADTPDFEASGDWAINLERQGAALNLDECCQAGYCGMNGTISGLYLPLDGGPPPNLRD